MKHLSWVNLETKLSHGVNWLAGLLAVVSLVVLLVVIARTDTPDGLMTRFVQAHSCQEQSKAMPLTRAGIAAMLDQTPNTGLINPNTQPECWRPATLPIHKPAQALTMAAGAPQLSRVWYRISYTLPKDFDLSQPLMVYIPRVTGFAWQVNIMGQPVADNRNDWRNTWNRPLAATFSASRLLPLKAIEIDIGVIQSEAAGYAIGRITVGEAKAIINEKSWREFVQVTMPQASSVVMFVLGFIFLVFWLARRSDTLYLLMTFSSLVFCAFNLKFALPRPEDANLNVWYNILINYLPIPWLNWSAPMFAIRFSGCRLLWFERLLAGYAITITFVVIGLSHSPHDHTLLIVAVYTVFAILCIGVIVWFTIVSKNKELYVITTSFVTGAYAVSNDLLLTANLIDPETPYLVPHCGIIYFAACLYALQRRYVIAINNQEQLSANLAARLAEREAELNVQHIRLRELERAQTLSNERQRLMHDMHDGLGSSLLSTLAAIEKSNMPHDAVADALRGCIDDLRLVIDSLEPTANDLVTLLGTIRYRLGQRLEAAGLKLIWEINDLPPLPWLEPPDALNVLRLVQEALVNVLKHANASQVRVTTRNLGEHIEIQVEDNGVGFDPNTIKSGRGTHSQAKRADKLGGELQVDSISGVGTSLRLILPICKNGTK